MTEAVQIIKTLSHDVNSAGDRGQWSKIKSQLTTTVRLSGHIHPITCITNT